jgi:hypothetical protein
MKQLSLAIIALLTSLNLHAQLFVDDTYTIDQMINGFFNNSGVTVSNVTYTGTPSSLAFFEGSQSNLGINAGLMMTTGQASLAVGPNTVGGAGVDMFAPGTPWLNSLIPGYVTQDAAVIEMDVVPSTDTLRFKYVFGSEEYLEFVNSSFNDLFAFLVEGPGLPSNDSIWVAADTTFAQDWNNCYICVDKILAINETYCYYDSLTMLDTCFVYSDTLFEWCYYDPNCVGQIDTIIYPGYWYLSPGGVNIAQIPNTNLPVAINTLNQFVNTQYFVDNENGATLQYDAFTTPLWAELAVQAGETYHIRVAIADAGDGIFDSGVFMSIESMGGDSLLPVIPEFALVAPTLGQNEVTFENKSFWGTDYNWDFGDGITSTEKNPTHNYAANGTYTAKLTVSNWCSSKTFEQSVFIGVSGTSDIASEVFRVMPNPTSGSFTLDIKNDAETTIRLTRLDGKLVFNGKAQDGARFDLNKYGKGTYILQVIANGKVFTEKVLNQ